MPHIWIDADSCPAAVRNHIVKVSPSLNSTVTFVANRSVACPLSGFEMVVCPQVKDAADTYILEHACVGDLVVTRDIVFAERLVSAGIAAINDRGTEFTREKVSELLSDRDFDSQLAQIGLVKRFHEGYDEKKLQKFLKCFDRVMCSLLRQ